MKGTTRILSILAVALLSWGAAACKKQASSQAPKTLEESITQMRAALVNASKEAQRSYYNEVEDGIRYERYAQALSGLERIAADPSLNPQQKKLVSEVTELLRARMEGQPSAAAPAR